MDGSKTEIEIDDPSFCLISRQFSTNPTNKSFSIQKKNYKISSPYILIILGTRGYCNMKKVVFQRLASGFTAQGFYYLFVWLLYIRKRDPLKDI